MSKANSKRVSGASAVRGIAMVRKADGWKAANDAEDRLVESEQVEARQDAEDALRQSHPWGVLNSCDRALIATIGTAEITESGDGCAADAETLLRIINVAIHALERMPDAKAAMAGAAYWPSFVPGGGATAPLRKAWEKEFALRGVGSLALHVPKAGRVHLEIGKPAWFAMNAFGFLDDARRAADCASEIQDKNYRAKAWEIFLIQFPGKAGEATKKLPALSKNSATEWRDAALLFFEEQYADWDFWVSFLDRDQTIKEKVGKLKHGTAKTGTVKSAVSLALLEGFRALAAQH